MPCRQAIPCGRLGHHNRACPHHHTSEHSNSCNFRTRILPPILGQTTHCSKPGPIITDPKIHKNQHARPDAPKPIHPDKEQIRSPSTIRLGANIRLSVTHPLCRVMRSRKSKLEFPHTTNNDQPNQRDRQKASTKGFWWRWTESNRRPPACKAGALPIELHPQLKKPSSRLPFLSIMAS